MRHACGLIWHKLTHIPSSYSVDKNLPTTVSLKSRDKSICNYAICIAKFSINSKLSYLIQQKCVKFRDRCTIFASKCNKNSENTNSNASCYKNLPKTHVTIMIRSFGYGIVQAALKSIFAHKTGTERKNPVFI